MYDDYELPPQPDSNTLFRKPASVHYMKIGEELAGDYKFGYDTGKANDGQSFREETRLPDGTVQGAYGYIDETGRQRIVKYTAGKDGFKAEGDIGPHRTAGDSQSASTPARRPAQSTTARRSPVQSPPAPARPAQSVPVHRPEVPPQQVYRSAPSQQAYRPSPPQAYRSAQSSPRHQPEQDYVPPQQAPFAPPEPVAEYEPVRRQQAYRPAPRHQVAPEYAPEPVYSAPPPAPVQQYVPRSSRRPSVSPRIQSQRHNSRYTPEPVERLQYDEPDYDYPDNDVTPRRLVPVDTSLFNYNIGTRQ